MSTGRFLLAQTVVRDDLKVKWESSTRGCAAVQITVDAAGVKFLRTFLSTWLLYISHWAEAELTTPAVDTDDKVSFIYYYYCCCCCCYAAIQIKMVIFVSILSRSFPVSIFFLSFIRLWFLITQKWPSPNDGMMTFRSVQYFPEPSPLKYQRTCHSHYQVFT